MKSKRIPSVILNIGFTKEWRDNELYFIFCGVSEPIVCNVLSKMRCLYEDYIVTTETRTNIPNGVSHKRVVAFISRPLFNILSESEWPMMISRLLNKYIPCHVTFYPDANKFLNA